MRYSRYVKDGYFMIGEGFRSGVRGTLLRATLAAAVAIPGAGLSMKSCGGSEADPKTSSSPNATSSAKPSLSPTRVRELCLFSVLLYKGDQDALLEGQLPPVVKLLESSEPPLRMGIASADVGHERLLQIGIATLGALGTTTESGQLVTVEDESRLSPGVVEISEVTHCDANLHNLPPVQVLDGQPQVQVKPA
jgi:hypothetical protein